MSITPSKRLSNWKLTLSLSAVAFATFFNVGKLYCYDTHPTPCNLESDSDCFSQPIISACIRGGIGNQMFQIAAAYAYALDVGGKPILQNEKIQHVGNSPIFSKLEHFKDGQRASETIQEKNFQYLELPKGSPHSLHLEGHFFSAKYFDHRRKEILELFSPSPEIKESLQSKYRDLLNQDTVAVHVRRRDYTTIQWMGENLLCNLADETDYYQNAIQLFDKENQYFVIFSDDIKFAKQMPEFINLKHVIFIEGQKAHEDLYLMSMCKHQIIANSTFSWWGAYLCENSNQKVACPIAFWGPAATNHASDQSGFWGPPISESGFHPNGICCQGPEYFPMDHWIRVE